MGEAKRRGTFEQRKAQSIAAGGIRKEDNRKILYRKFIDVFTPPKEPNRIVLAGGTPVYLAIRGIVKTNIKQPGDNRKEHKTIVSS
ncbi:MAG: hypothetical protein HGJ94_17255 [Desulfosarcina sp.]|nr:hypothetical protein [Desulfosarcina sp.]MBC2742112.1 hypothetical protein [Desulfosarcina sp.]MBC2765025.1 hypothetical protein [Desulfosarcina sp.]